MTFLYRGGYLVSSFSKDIDFIRNQRLYPQHLGALFSKSYGRAGKQPKTISRLIYKRITYTISGPITNFTVKQIHIGSAVSEILRYRQKMLITLYNRITITKKKKPHQYTIVHQTTALDNATRQGKNLNLEIGIKIDFCRSWLVYPPVNWS